MEPLVLAFDIGTQSVRALLTRKNGTFVDIEKLIYDIPYFSEKSHWAEQDPFYYYDCICKASRNLLNRNPDVVGDIICVTLTAIRDTTLCLDKDNTPLRDMVVWLDKREAEFHKENLGSTYNAIFKLIGMSDTIEAQYKASVCNWIMQNQPEIWKKTNKFVLLSCFLNFLFTGNLVDSVGSTIGHLPFDYKRKTWMKDNDLSRVMADIPNEKLCDLVEPGTIIGNITLSASIRSGIPEGLPVVAAASDKGCETLGLSVRKPGAAAISFGTSATVQIATEKYITPQNFLPAYPGAIPGVYNPEIQIFRGFWMITWFIKEFCSEEAERAKRMGVEPERFMDSFLKSVPAGCDGLVVQPFWTAGVGNPNARGSMVGFTDKQTKYHIYRAIIEGINFELNYGMRQLEKRSRTPIKEIFVGGGGARSNEVLQIVADVFGLPVKRIQTHEACAIGASIVAFVAMGEFKDYEEACESMIRVKDVFNPNKKNHNFYKEMQKNVYEGIYSGLEPQYKKEKLLFKKMRK